MNEVKVVLGRAEDDGIFINGVKVTAHSMRFEAQARALPKFSMSCSVKDFELDVLGADLEFRDPDNLRSKRIARDAQALLSEGVRVSYTPPMDSLARFHKFGIEIWEEGVRKGLVLYWEVTRPLNEMALADAIRARRHEAAEMDAADIWVPSGAHFYYRQLDPVGKPNVSK